MASCPVCKSIFNHITEGHGFNGCCSNECDEEYMRAGDQALAVYGERDHLQLEWERTYLQRESLSSALQYTEEWEHHSIKCALAELNGLLKGYDFRMMELTETILGWTGGENDEKR